MSWLELDEILRPPTEEEKKQQEKHFQDIVSDFVSTFSSESGRRVLKYLRSNTIERSTYVESSDGAQMQKLQDMREGENNLVRRIERYLKNGGVEI